MQGMTSVLQTTLMIKQSWKSWTAFTALEFYKKKKQGIGIRMNNTGCIHKDVTYFKMCFSKA